MKKSIINFAIVSCFTLAAMPVYADSDSSMSDRSMNSDSSESGTSGADRSRQSSTSRSDRSAQSNTSGTERPRQSGTSRPDMSEQSGTSADTSRRSGTSSRSESSWDGHGTSGHASSYRPSGIEQSNSAGEAKSDSSGDSGD